MRAPSASGRAIDSLVALAGRRLSKIDHSVGHNHTDRRHGRRMTRLLCGGENDRGVFGGAQDYLLTKWWEEALVFVDELARAFHDFLRVA